ncbi:hypothetical protein C8Q80DRAFT_565798 [Daedaleopsis nitida]|nr:hypothetical protein C8Q80DRAFT_565798 [Daedaleopsis nitida]
MEKRLENVIREANGEISLLTSKMNELERDLDAERRKTANIQDSLKESEKEYHKLKAQYDKLKRKALLGGASVGGSKDGALQLGNQTLNMPDRHVDAARLKQGMTFGSSNGMRGVDVGAVVGNMEAAGIQRTPIVNRTMTGFPVGMQSGSAWRQPQSTTHTRGRQPAQRHPFSTTDGSFRTSVSTTRSDHSDSTAEVENLLAQTGAPRGRHGNHSGLAGAMSRGSSVPIQSRAFGQSSSKRTGPKFKPAGAPMG